MKKSLALILAAMMVAGTASVAFAATTDPKVYVDEDSQLYKWDKDESVYVKISNNSEVRYGDKIAIALQGDDKDEKKEVNKNKVFPDWKVGSSLVESAEIEYRKTEDVSYEERYTLKNDNAVEIKEYALTAAPSSGDAVVGEKFKITLTAGVFKGTEFYENTKEDEAQAMTDMRGYFANSSNLVIAEGDKGHTVTWAQMNEEDRKEVASKIFKEVWTEDSVEQERGYKYLVVIELKDSTSTKTQDLSGDIRVGKTITDAKNNKDDGYYFNLEMEVKNKKTDDKIGDVVDTVTVDLDKYTDNFVLDVDDNAGVTDIEFGKDGELALFTVDLDGQSDVNVGYSTKFNADIADKYPAANLEFIKWTANPTFNRTGDLYIYADEDSFIYEVTADGLKEISKAEYDEDYGAWKIRTRKLGSYVISDEELDVTASTSSSEASSSGTSSSNPVTGGTTGTTGGNTNVKPNPNTGR